MKIYTLTFQFTTNYGATLQMFALYNYLSSKGHEVQVIDYWPEYAEKSQHWYSNIMSSYKSVLLAPTRIINSIIFSKFTKERVCLTKKCKTVSDVSSLPDADVIFVGSDQVWNPELISEVNDVYFLNFSTKSWKASYAASIGQDKLDDTKIGKILPLIERFDSISVREDVLFEVLKTNGIQKVKHVVDPVFLQNKSVYQSILKKPKQQKYVLTYYSDKEHLTEKLAKKIAREKDCIVLKMGSYNNKAGIIGTRATSVEDFLGLIADAECIVTPSFHAIAFSIIFEKNFYAINAGERSSRLTSLLNNIGLSGRFIPAEADIEKIQYEAIAYTEPMARLNELIEESREYIETTLNMASEKKKSNQ